MRKILVILCVVTVAAITNVKASNSYFVNDNAIEQVFTNSVEKEVSFSLTEESFYNQEAQLDGKEPIIAIALDFFLGGIAIHRVYLGGRPTLILLYFITCGGIFGIVPLVDLIVLAINYDDISAFVDNDKFIMW